MPEEYITIIKKFDKQGEKTGWTYIEVPADIAEKLNPENKKSFRVKGKLDTYRFQGISLLPMGNGNYIMTLNAAIRKKIKKGNGAMINVVLSADHSPVLPPEWFIECMEDEPLAKEKFYSLTKGHQNYFIKWIETARTEATKVKRTTKAINALAKGMDFGEMLRNHPQI